MKDIMETITRSRRNIWIYEPSPWGSLCWTAAIQISTSPAKVYSLPSGRQTLFQTGEEIEKKYGIPIVNKRVSVTPIAMLTAVSGGDPVKYAHALDKAAKKIGVNFIGGYTALVQKGFAAGDRELIESIPRALAETDFVCSSVNVGSTKAGINMDAVKMMGNVVKEASQLTSDRQCIGAAKLVVFCNAPEDNPFMAGAFHGVGEPDCVINVGVSGPGVVRAALSKLPKDAPLSEVADLIKETAFKITVWDSWSEAKLCKTPFRDHRSVPGSDSGGRRFGSSHSGRDRT